MSIPEEIEPEDTEKMLLDHCLIRKAKSSIIIIMRRNIKDPMQQKGKKRKVKLACESDYEGMDKEPIANTIENLLSNLSMVSQPENRLKNCLGELPSKVQETSKASDKNSPSILLEFMGEKRGISKTQESMGGSLSDCDFKRTLKTLKTREFKRSSFRNISQPFQSQFKNIRIGQLCKNIKLKIARNNVFRHPKNQSDLQKFQKKKTKKRIQIPEYLQVFLNCLHIVVIVCFIVLISIMVSFSRAQSTDDQDNIFIIMLMYLICQIAAKFVFVTKDQKMSELSLQEHTYFYLKSVFLSDFLLVTLILLRVVLDDQYIIQVMILSTIPTKIPELLRRINQVQKKIMTNIAYQRYASIVKIILFNFAFAHFVAVCLNLMTNINPQSNWQITRGIHLKCSFQRYVWSYYWATTIMLTIGFGDIVPTTYQEALCVIFIEIISCIAFSYNISCLGSILAAIQERNEKVDNNRKIFNFIASKNNFSNGLIKKVENFIEDEAELKERFYIEEEKQFIQSLPEGCKKQLVCESNINMLKGLPFFGPLFKTSIYKLSHYIIKQIYTPEEVISTPHSDYCFKILQAGSISYFCNQKTRKFSGLKINKVERTQRQKPFLMDLQVVSLQHHKYSIKSLVYSIVHKLHIDDFVRVLREMPKDYEYYCYLKDQSKHKIDEYETVECKQCQSRHTYFDCPRYHYMPIKSQVLNKHLQSVKVGSNTRSKDFHREEKTIIKPLKAIISSIYDIQLSEKSLCKPQKKNVKYQSIFQGMKKQINNATIMEKIFYLTQSEHQIEINDEIWDLNLDTVRSYDHYFPESNIRKISKKLNLMRYQMSPFLSTLENIGL